MQVKIIKATPNYSVGAKIDVNQALGDHLVSEGFAEVIKEKPAKAAPKKAAAKKAASKNA